MRRLSQRIAGIAVAAALILPIAARADDQDNIDYRQNVMKTFGAQVKALSMIADGKAPKENAAVHAQILAIAASTALDAFKEKSAGGEAKPDVWAKWDDFSKKMNEFATASAQFAKDTKAGGLDPAKLKATLTCKGCHDAYREQKK